VAMIDILYLHPMLIVPLFEISRLGGRLVLDRQRCVTSPSR
jgi:hypothetical protein